MGVRRQSFDTTDLKVRLTYHSDEEGREVEIPLVVGVLGAFRGHRRDRDTPFDQRKFESVTANSLDAVMRGCKPRLALAVPDAFNGGEIAVELTFSILDDFHPQAVLQRIPMTAGVLRLREALVEAKHCLAGGRGSADHGGSARGAEDGETGDRETDDGQNSGGEAVYDVAQRITRRYVAQSDAVSDPLSVGPDLAREIAAAVGPARLREAVEAIDLALLDLDERLSRQCDAILHDPAFQRLEGLWRGVDLLVRRTQGDPLVDVKILDVDRAELDTDLSTHERTGDFGRETLRASRLFDLIYTQEYGQYGGNPFALIVLDDHLAPRAADMRLAERLATIGEAAHCLFVSSAAPAMFNLSSFDDLDWDRADLDKLFHSDLFLDWRALRTAPCSRYLGLVLPRFLARHPYAVAEDVGLSFPYDEATRSRGDFLWANGGFAFALTVLGAFIRHRWCVSITGLNGGGAIDDLPVLDFGTGEGSHVFRLSVERAISTRRERDLAAQGFIPLIQRPGQRHPAFFSAFSVHLPTPKTGSDAVSDRLSARLPYMFAASRIAHYVKANMRERIGSEASLSRFQSNVSRWISQYVAYQDDIDEYLKAERPLRDATVTVFQSEDEVERFSFLMELQPHFQLEEMGVRLSVGSKPDDMDSTSA